MIRWLPIGFVAVAVGCMSAPNPVVVDGEFSDWAGEVSRATDQAGDATGAFDLTRVAVTSRDAVVYIRFDVGRVLNLQNGPPEEGTLIIEVGTGDPDSAPVVKVDVRDRSVLLAASDEPTTWAAVDYRSAPTFAADEFEIQIDLAPVGLAAGDRVLINFSGSDSLEEALSHELRIRSTLPSAHSGQRERAGDLRIASLNVWRDRLVHPQHGPAMARLLRAAGPDIVALQEVYEATDDEIRSFLRTALGGGEWRIHRVFDCVVAAQVEVVPIPTHSEEFAAAVVRLDRGDLVVFSIHPQCCGYIGSEEDVLRIQQFEAMLLTIDALREGRSRPGREFASAPIVVMGDWNLVGSRTPLDMMTDPAGPGLVHRPLLDLTERSPITWRDRRQWFAPGMLDLVVYDAAQLVPGNGFVLDSEVLPDAALSAMKVGRDDSRASDHLLLVADFRLRQGPVERPREDSNLQPLPSEGSALSN